MNFDTWIKNLRELIQKDNCPITFSNNRWFVNNRENLITTLGSRIFNTHLHTLKSCAIEVLTEIDPQFELEKNERYVSEIHGKVLQYSPELRQGLAESLALISNNRDALPNCTINEKEAFKALTIREIFKNADWALWGSLNNLLPTLAEANPEEFLDAVEKALTQNPIPFIELFNQEGDGIYGRIYITGLLWALESLAWFEDYLVRVVVILAELASIDPGGQWSNRPINSIITILMPWFPQTLASVEKRKVSVKIIVNEQPDVAWKILIKLLPNQNQVSTGTKKPKWIGNIPHDWNERPSKSDYSKQIINYSEIAVNMAKTDFQKLNELVNNFDNLPKKSFEEVLKFLSTDTITKRPEEDRLCLWNNLTEFIKKHRRFKDAYWSLDEEIVQKIENVATLIIPTNPINLYSRLFVLDDFNLYEENDNWDKQAEKLKNRRRCAIEKIMNENGFQGIISLLEKVESPYQVGRISGLCGNDELDKEVLPTFLIPHVKVYDSFSSGYISARFEKIGWNWVDKLSSEKWNVEQINHLLISLPFEDETWKRVENLLTNSENMYWESVPVNQYQKECNLLYAVDKLIKYLRPQDAVNCLYTNTKINKNSIDVKRSVKALLAVASLSSENIIGNVDIYRIIDLIKELQTVPDMDEKELFNVEWTYLQLLERDRGGSPKLLEKWLATKPEFFCEMIEAIYLPKGESKPEGTPTEVEKFNSNNAWQLLYNWKVPPGFSEDGSFDDQKFIDWIKVVKELTRKSGHLDISLLKVGEVLIYCPSDESGLWINKTVAYELNQKDSEEMRSGFRSAFYNSRGAHSVDPTGKPEFELAEKYRTKADDVENEGFHRLAITLKELAESYEREANRIIEEHKNETNE